MFNTALANLKKPGKNAIRAGFGLQNRLSGAWFWGCVLVAAGGCSSSDAAPSAPPAVTFQETALTLNLTLEVSAPMADGGSAGVGGAAGEGGAIGAVGAPATATLTIVASDGATPVVTDLWLYTLDETEQKTPLTAFTSTGARKTPSLMLPATIAGAPSGLTPADDGRKNGLMTNTTRGKLQAGAFVSTVDGKVVVTLASVPTTPILVIAGEEDQRYAGAAAINADGTSHPVPDDAIVLETHTRVSYARDVAPVLKAQCTKLCHYAGGPNGADMYLLDTQDHLVNDNFAITEGTADCRAANPDGGAAFDVCVQAINKAQFLVEPGAPAVTDLLQRARPDEEKGSSATGLLWFGGGTPKSRYNAKYGDRRMPSTTILLDAGDWDNLPTAFDHDPKQFQVLFDWVAQGAQP